MKSNLLVLICAIFIVTACSTKTDSPTAAGSAAFQAEASSAVSVELAWEAVDRADYYLIELSFGEDFFPVATVEANVTAFEHFPLPDNTELTYRLRAFSGGVEIGSEREVTLTTPEAEPDPLIVEAIAYEPVSPLANFEMPVTDPNDPNFDPAAFANLLPIDPETGEVDLEALMGEPVNSSEEIGSEGGSVAVTSPDGITYTLVFPEGALQEPRVITLTPIETIKDLPVENFLGAVDIQPDGLILETPAMLTISFPEEVIVPEGMVTMNFAYIGSGYDFHFVPYFEGEALVSSHPAGVGGLAKPAPRPLEAGPLSGISVEQLGGRGLANGSPEKIRSTIKNKSGSTRSSRRNNRAAAAQMNDDLAPLIPVGDDLAPLIPPHLSQAVNEIQAKISSVSRPSQLTEAISDFSSYIYSYGNQPALRSVNDKLWNQLTDKTYDSFNVHKDECLTEGSFNNQAIASKMVNATAGFWKTFRERYSSRQGGAGQDLLKKIEDLIRKCNFEFDTDSNITLTAEGTTIQAHIIALVPLTLTINPSGTATFKGIGSIKYQGPVVMNAPDCPNFLTEVKDLTGSKLEVWDLAPQFDSGGKLTDFKMISWEITGTQTKLKGKCEDGEGEGFLPSYIQADIWGGMFNYSHAPGFPFVGWDIKDNNPSVASSKIVAELEFDWPNRAPIFGGRVKEHTTIQFYKLP